MSLSDEIMNLPCPKHSTLTTNNHPLAFMEEGFRLARDAAAQLAVKRDAEHAAHVERLEALYRDAREALARQRGPELIQQEQFDRDTQAALTKARTG